MARFSGLKIIIIIFLILPVSSALGVSPGKVNINFEPNLNTSFEMGVLNDPPKNQEADIYISLLYLDDEMKKDFANTLSLEKHEYLSQNKTQQKA